MVANLEAELVLYRDFERVDTSEPPRTKREARFEEARAGRPFSLYSRQRHVSLPRAGPEERRPLLTQIRHRRCLPALPRRALRPAPAARTIRAMAPRPPEPAPASAADPDAEGALPAPPTIRERYRSAFLKGVATLLPTILTVYILLWTWSFVEGNIGEPLNAAIKAQLKATAAGREVAVRLLDLNPELLRPDRRAEFDAAVEEAFPRWLGLAAAVVLCFTVGFFIASFVGRRAWAALEGWFVRLPVIRAIYPSAKQITEFFIKHEEGPARQFSRVCFVPFPTPDQWTIGFVMSEGFRGVDEVVGKRHVNVFIPWAPTPVTGFVLLVPEDQVHPIDLSVDEALKFYVTAGLVVPRAHLASTEAGGGGPAAGAGAGGPEKSAPAGPGAEAPGAPPAPFPPPPPVVS